MKIIKNNKSEDLIQRNAANKELKSSVSVCVWQMANGKKIRRLASIEVPNISHQHFAYHTHIKCH